MKELLDKISSNNLVLEIVEGKLKLFAKDNDFDQSILAEIKANAVALADFLKRNDQGGGKAAEELIPNVPATENYLLSSSQKRLWILNQLEENNVAYHMPGVYVFEGKLNTNALTAAFSKLIERHEILRTVFREDGQGEIKQYISEAKDTTFTISSTDLSADKNIDERVKSLIKAEMSIPFDLTTGPLLRASLFKIEKSKWIFVYEMHHIISDGWSMGVLIRELLEFYEAYGKEENTQLLPLRIQYKDYADWQQKQLNNGSSEATRTYWLDQFEGKIPVLQLPVDRAHPPLRTYAGGIVYRSIGKETHIALKTLAIAQGSTSFMALLATVKILLFRYTGENDLVVGTPVAGRDLLELENQIGFYTNTLALRSYIEENDTYYSVLNKIKKTTLGAYEHQSYPFDKLVEELNLTRDMSRSPLFDVMVSLDMSAAEKQEENNTEGKLKISPYSEAEHTTSKFDLSFDFAVSGDDLHMSIEYNGDIYEPETIERFAGHFTRLLESVVADPQQQISAMEYITEEEKIQLLQTFNAGSVAYSQDKTLISLFKEQVLQRPTHTAVKCNEKEISYSELDELSDKLCRYISTKAMVNHEDLIGVKIQRNEWLLVSVLAVFKLGGAYVPIDPAYPEERVNYLLENSNCKFLIDDQLITEFLQQKNSIEQESWSCTLKLSDLAYVIYTSGSTGKPKGTMIEHEGMLNHMYAMIAQLEMNSETIIVQNAAYTFDISVWQLLTSLIVGGTVAVYDNDTVLNPHVFMDKLQSDKITILQVVPSYLKSVLYIADQ